MDTGAASIEVSDSVQCSWNARGCRRGFSPFLSELLKRRNAHSTSRVAVIQRVGVKTSGGVSRVAVVTRESAFVRITRSHRHVSGWSATGGAVVQEETGLDA